MNQEKIFGSFIERNVRVIKRTYLRSFKDNNIDLTPEQWVLIDILSSSDGMSQNDLAGKSFKDAPTTSRILDLLAKKGFIARKKEESDRRSFKVFLTDEGRALHTRGLPIVQELRTKGWKGLNDEDYDAFLRIMNQIFENFPS